MGPLRARVGAATLSVLLHALLLWMVAGWSVATPVSEEPPPDRVIVSLAPPRQPPPAPAMAPPPPAGAQPPPPDAAAESVEPPPEAEQAEPPPELEIPLPEQQIVSMPDAGEEKPPDDTRFLSDRDNTVEQQTVKRGEPAPSRDEDGDDTVAAEPEADDAAPDTEMAAAERPDDPAQAANRPAENVGSLSAGDGAADRPLDLASLLPDALKLAAQQAQSSAAAEQQAGGAPEKRSRPRRAAAWQPTTTLRGTLDHLPDVRAGHVTLLNTKAEVFAPFVRRVMLRVFQNMMIFLRRAGPSLRPGVREQIEAEAIMSPEGRMIGLRITQQSASRSIGLDRMLTDACNEAFFDRNPPPGAAGSDGNIHFVLQTMVQTYPSVGRRGVALSGIFGVGLL